MSAADKNNMTPRERLEGLEDVSPLRPPLVRSPYFLTAVGLLLIMLSIVAVAVMLGFGMVEALAPYGEGAREVQPGP
jgi:predicted lysophospholipase L1 biosynthesis ABC-type transport system permease subunit